MVRKLRDLFRLLAVILVFAAAAWSVQASAQDSLDAPENEVSQPLPGDDGGSVEPAKKLAPNQIMFVIRSTHPRAVDVAFYSNDRRHAWPGKNRVYTIRNSKTHHYVLNCERGEKVCYGAGVRNRYRTYWGTGIGNRHRCPTCCYICNGNATKTIVLNP
jgi:hypothetical protein